MNTKKIHFKDIFREPADGASIINIEKSLQAYNIIHDQEKLTLDQLYKEIIDRNLDNDLKIYFSKLDQYSNPQLDHYKPITHERRNKIYELFGFPDKLSEAISKIVPVLENSEKLIALVGDRISEPWIDDLDNENYWWNVYKDSLNKTLPNDVKDKVITDLDISTNTILDYLDPPDKELAYKTRGIVVGHVQSGKTSNMQGLAVKAIDAGFKIIIVLSGVNRILRAQTQRRFDKQILGKEVISPGIIFDENFVPDPSHEYQEDEDFIDFVTHGNNYRNASIKVHRLTTSINNGFKVQKGKSAVRFKNHFEPERINTRKNLNMNDAYFAAIMKNKRGIENLKNEIIESGLREELKNIPILVIDDESDAASVNVASRKNDQNAVSATNKAIRDLLKELPRAQYVAYTATPSANFFINPDIAEDIFPKDFAIALPTPPGYMGGQDFEKKKFIRDIWLEDTDRNLETLRQAVDSYVLAGAVKLFRVKEKNIHPNLIKHHTMLIHESANNQEQEDLATKYLTKEIWNKHDYYGGDGLKRLKSLYEKDFLPHSETLIEEESIANDMPSFGLLKKYILEAIRKIESGGEIFKIVNQLYPEPDFSKENIWKIFIGGQKISRGYTIEGLTISYYTRPTTAGDTLQQMARWFGYRKNYKDLVRLYICRNASKRRNRDLYHEFIGLTAQENRLRKKLLNAPDKKNAYEKDLTPISWSYIVRADSDLPPTRKSAMQDVELVTDNFARDYKESELFPTKKEIERIENNYSTLVNFFNQPQIEMKEYKLGFKGETSYSYITAKADPSTFLDNFLLKFKMQEDKPDPWRYVKDYLLERDFDNEIDQWLLMVVKGTGSELLKYHEENDITTNLNGFKVTCVKRTRKDFSKGKESHGGFVSSVPEHRVFAEYLSYPETFSKDLYIRDSKTDFNALYSELENKKTAVALIYLANFIELEPVHSVGISLFFPDNGQPKVPVFKFKKDRPSY